MTLRDASLRTRLLLAFAAVMAMLSLAVATGVFGLSQFNSGVHNLTDERLIRLDTANQWVVELLETARHTRNVLILDDKAQVRQEIDAIRVSQRQRKQYRERLAAEVSGSEERAVLQAAIDLDDRYLPLEDQYLEQIEAGQLAEGKVTLLERTRPAQLLFLDKLKRFSAYETSQVKIRAGELDSAYRRSINVLAIACLAAIATAVLLALRITNAVARPLAAAIGVLHEIERGNFTSSITVSSNDETGQLLRALATMQSNLKERTDRDHELANETGRIKCALDRASSSVMLADENLNIIYVNEAAQQLFRANQADFRLDLPDFDAERIIGSNIDIFHKNPAHERQLLAGLRDTHQAEIRVGGRALRIAASPVLASAGGRAGTVLEWLDRTQEVRAEEEVGAIVKAALDGDLSRRIALDDKTGFYATLAGSLNELLENMSQIIGRIKSASSEVLRGADEISEGNANLSQRTEEQSASLEETAASMEEMTATVRHSADNAAEANQLAMASREQAEKGGAVVAKAVSAMADINDASMKIADIIGVIDELAFQTNLLALNAAVEAARAGEQGRGFAVVASEVRNLAGRSATAAKAIKELIQDSVAKVRDGSALVTQSGQSLEQIVAAVKKVSDIIAEIAAASREQSSGIAQVGRAVTQMDQATQQNAALVEQTTAASQSMADQARQLSEMIGKYSTKATARPEALFLLHRRVEPRQGQEKQGAHEQRARV